MKKWKKSGLAMLAFLLVTMMILPACSSTSDKIEITQYTLDSEDKAYVEKLVAEFENEHPNIKVKIMKAPYNEFDSKLQGLIAGGNAPDIASHFGDAGFIEYYDKGLIRDMSDLLTDFKASDYGIPEQLMDIYKVDGKTYGIPVYSYVSLLVYNKDLFDAAKVPYPPADYEDASWTYEKMIETARKLTKVSDKLEESVYGLDFGWSELDMRPIYFGAKVYSDDTWKNGGHPSEVYFDKPEVAQAYQEMADMIYKDKVAVSPAFSKAVAGEGGDPFATGKVGMAVGGAWLLAGAADFSFKVGVAAIPKGKNDKVRDVLFVDPLFILKDSKHPKEALEWIKFQLKKETQEKAIELSGGTPPSNQQALDKYLSFFPTIDANDLKKVVDGGIKYGTESYNHLIAGYSEILNIVKNETDPLFNGLKPSAAELMPGLQKNVSAVLKKK